MSRIDWTVMTESIWYQDFPLKSNSTSTHGEGKGEGEGERSDISIEFELVLKEFVQSLELNDGIDFSFLDNYDYSRANHVYLIPSVPGKDTLFVSILWYQFSKSFALYYSLISIIYVLVYI